MPRLTQWHEHGVTQADAFAAAERALAERFHIQERNPKAGVVRSAPVLTHRAQQGYRLGDTVGAERPVRMVAEVSVRPAGDGVDFISKVVIEENEAGAHEAFGYEHSLSDIPSDTPADREGSTRREQSEAWRVTGRDRRLESEIRESISEILHRRTGK